MSGSDITPNDLSELLRIFGESDRMFQQTPSTKKKKTGGSDRSSQLAKKKQEIKELKQNIKIYKTDMKRLQADTKMALDRISELEGDKDYLTKRVAELYKRIEELNHFGREDILDMED